LIDLCHLYKGVGLAANQIGHNESMFVFSCRDSLKVAINPEIVEVGEPIPWREGCLSIPGITFELFRPESCFLSAYDEKGDQYEIELDGLSARIVQHENDHLLGTTMIDLLDEDQLEEFNIQWPSKRLKFLSNKR
jgi:peptide deformylase